MTNPFIERYVDPECERCNGTGIIPGVSILKFYRTMDNFCFCVIRRWADESLARLGE